MCRFLGTLLLIGCCFTAFGQSPLRLRSLETGLRWWEIGMVANNPYTVRNVLKDPAPLTAYIQQFERPGYEQSGYTGNPGIENALFLFLQGTWGKASPAYFWRHFSLTGGLLFSLPHRTDNGTLFQQHPYQTATDTGFIRTTYSLTDRHSYAALSGGLLWRSRPARPLRFTLGLQLQGTATLGHAYDQSVDTLRFSRKTGQQSVIAGPQMERLQGKRLHFWQVYVPLGLEYQWNEKPLYLRLELNLGRLKGKYRTGEDFEVANGLGLTFGWKPGKVRSRE